MAILKIVKYGEESLRQKSKEISKISKKIKVLAHDMIDTMYANNGVGLAAPQVGVSQRVLVIDYERDEEHAGNPIYMVNPEIIWKSEEKVCGEEGCLSVPGQRAEVERYAQVRVRYLDYNGKEQEVLADDFFAIVVQHEMDHLDGILYIDRISRLKRSMLLKKLKKEKNSV